MLVLHNQNCIFIMINMLTLKALVMNYEYISCHNYK